MTEEEKKKKELSRRDFLYLSGLLGASTLLSACAPAATPEPEVITKVETKVVKETEIVEKIVKETQVVEKGLRDVPRERTLVLTEGGDNMGVFADAGIGTPLCTGGSSQRGMPCMWEGLIYFNPYSGEEIPWLAESYEYNDDYTEVTLKIRKGVEWQDGVPFTAKDVVFTMDYYREHGDKLWSAFGIWEQVKEAILIDDYTCKLVLDSPRPRFVFDKLTYTVVTMRPVPMVIPEHIYKDVEEPTEFKFFDPEKGWPVNTGPYRLVLHTMNQRFYDLNHDWWAARTGFAPLPEVERIIIFPAREESTMVQMAIQGLIDSAHLQVSAVKEVLEQNPKVITHTGRNPPYGFEDTWPIAICFNLQEPPFNDPNLRWALCHAIDRDQAIEVAFEGANRPNCLPFNTFESLQPYFDHIADLLENYPTCEFNLEKSAQRMQAAGYTKDAGGFWSKGGQRFSFELDGYDFMADQGVVVAEQLRNGGFDCTWVMPPDMSDRWTQGTADSFLFGTAGGIADPWATMDKFHSRHARPTGEASGWPAWRYKNPELDKIIDAAGALPPRHPEVMNLWYQFMEIWLPELPCIPLWQYYNNLPMNTEYWTNWPTEENKIGEGIWWKEIVMFWLPKLKATKS